MLLASVMDDNVKLVSAMEFDLHPMIFSKPSYFQALELAEEAEGDDSFETQEPLELSYGWSDEHGEEAQEYEAWEEEVETDESGKSVVSAEEEFVRLSIGYSDNIRKFLLSSLQEELKPISYFKPNFSSLSDILDRELDRLECELQVLGRRVSLYSDIIDADPKPPQIPECYYADFLNSRLLSIRPLASFGIPLMGKTSVGRYVRELHCFDVNSHNLLKNWDSNMLFQLSIHQNHLQEEDAFAISNNTTRWRKDCGNESENAVFVFGNESKNAAFMRGFDMKELRQVTNQFRAFLYDSYTVAKRDRFLQQPTHYMNEDYDLEKQSGSLFGQGMHGGKLGLLSSFLESLKPFPDKETEIKKIDNEAWLPDLEPSPPQPTGGIMLQQTLAHSLLLMATMLASVTLIGAVNPGISTGNSSFVKLSLLVWLNSIVFFTSIATIVFLMHKLPVMPWLFIATSSAIGVYMCAILANSPDEVVPVIFIGCSIFTAAFLQFLAWKHNAGNYIQRVRSMFLGINII